MNDRITGITFVMISAFIFGFTPILGKLSYAGGNNAVMLTFLRAFLAIPLLYVMLIKNNISFSLTKKEKRDIFILSVFGSSLTTFTLYASYNYIPVGLATTLHFIYPSLVLVYSIIFLGEKASKIQIIALFISSIGVLFFCDFGSQISITGVMLAIVSAASWAFNIVFLHHSGLVYLHPLKLCFYQSSIVSLLMLLFGIFSGKFTLDLTPAAMGYSFIVSLCVSIGAVSFLQMGIRYVGSMTASILSMLEPITSIVCGLLILNETITILNAIGCVIIVVGVALITLFSEKKATLGVYNKD